MDTIRPRSGLASPGLERPARDAAHGGPDPATSAATRYLCVGAHVDPEFADQVVHDLLEERHRAVCPSRGIDLVPIIRHCLAARRRRFGRDLAILAVLAASLVVSPVPTVALSITAWCGWLVHRLVKGWTARGPAMSLLLLGAFAGCLWVLALVAGLALRQEPLARGILEVRRELPGLLLLPLGVWAVVLIEAAQTRDVLVRQLSRRGFEPARAPARCSPAIRWRLEDLAREQYGNATVYSSFVPFVGSGVPFNTWSLAIDLRHSSSRGITEGPAPSPRVSIADLQARVVSQLGRLVGRVSTAATGSPACSSNGTSSSTAARPARAVRAWPTSREDPSFTSAAGTSSGSVTSRPDPRGSTSTCASVPGRRSWW